MGVSLKVLAVELDDGAQKSPPAIRTATEKMRDSLTRKRFGFAEGIEFKNVISPGPVFCCVEKTQEVKRKSSFLQD